MKKITILISVAFLWACGGESNQNEPAADTMTNSTDTVEEEVFVPMDKELTVVEGTAIPSECDYDGNLIDCYSWNDSNGENFFLRTMEEPELAETLDEGTLFYSQNLHAYHYIKDDAGKIALSRDLLDFVKECDFDIILYHLDDIQLTDLDEDNVGEILFGYRQSCTSDVSPSNQKVFIFENGDKYGLRGTAEALGHGGEYEPGEEFNSAPDGFLESAEQYWKKNKVEFEMEEPEFF